MTADPAHSTLGGGPVGCGLMQCWGFGRRGVFWYSGVLWGSKQVVNVCIASFEA